MRDVAYGAFFIAMLAIFVIALIAVLFDARLDSLEEIGTALTCEQVQGVVVCVEKG